VARCSGQLLPETRFPESKRKAGVYNPGFSRRLRLGRMAFSQVQDLLAQNRGTLDIPLAQQGHRRPSRPSLRTKGTAGRGCNTTSTTNHITIPQRIRTTLSAKVRNMVVQGFEH
jgi:hypothetical protein